MPASLKETHRAYGRVVRYINDRSVVEKVKGYVIDYEKDGSNQIAILYPEDDLLAAIRIQHNPSIVWTVCIFGIKNLITIGQFAVHVLPNILKNASFDHDLKADASLIQEGRILYPQAFHQPILPLNREIYTKEMHTAAMSPLGWQPGQEAAVFRKAIAKQGLLPLRFPNPEVEGKDLIMLDTLMDLASRSDIAPDFTSCGVRSIKIGAVHYIAIDDLTNWAAAMKDDLIINVSPPPSHILMVQGHRFDKREIGNDTYILSFLEKVEIAGWKAEDRKFERNGLIRTWVSCSPNNIHRHIARVSRANENEAKKDGVPFDASPFGNTQVASRISWNNFEKLFLPFLYAGRDTPGETLIKVYESKNKTVAKGWRGGSANVRQELDRNHQNVASAPAHHRQQLELERIRNEEAAEEQDSVPQEIVGNRTVPSHVILDAQDDDVQIVAIRRLDNQRAVKEIEIASRERIKMAELANEEKARQAEKEEKARQAEKEERLRDAAKEEKLATEATKQAEQVTAQRQIELELARLAAQTSPHRPPTPPQQPRRKAIRQHAPAQIRPRAAPDAIRRLSEYNIEMLVHYVASAFPDEGDIWESQIWDHFRHDQANPFLGFLPDNLSEQRSWLRSQLAQLVLNGRLYRSTYMGKAAYALI